MPIEKAKIFDTHEISRLYDDARNFLKSQGLDQWQDGYPNAESAREDILSGNCYIFRDNGLILGTACLFLGREPTYEKIYDGRWTEDPTSYAYLHRIAVSSSARGKGIAGLFFEKLEILARENGISDLRADTHRGNLPMQGVLRKSGFSYAGVIYLGDGAERLAYEKVLPKA